MVDLKIAVFSTVYPEGLWYFEDWFTSVNQQTNTHFDLWIGCDRISRREVLDNLGLDIDATWIEGIKNESSIIIRQRAFDRIIEKYEEVIFVDSDDVLEKTRVAAATNSLKTHDVYGCAMTLIDQNGHKIGADFRPPLLWDISTLLAKNNIFGLSNTAYRTGVLKKCLPFRPDCELLDWYIATQAWFYNATFDFDLTPQMLYRQHPNNIARVIPPFSSSQILMATSRVMHHYACILDGNSGENLKKREMVVNASNYVKLFYNTINHSPKILAKYIEELNRKPMGHIWWSCVAHPDLEEIWKT